MTSRDYSTINSKYPKQFHWETTMAPKRHVGLAKAGKNKRLKIGFSVPTSKNDSARLQKSGNGDSAVGGYTINGQSPEENNPLQELETKVVSMPTKGSMAVELSDDVDANDAMGQLKALWKNFIASDERNEQMVNAVIHECDRMLRKLAHYEDGFRDEEQIILVGEFYSIYALALSSSAFFHTENSQKVQEFFNEAEDRIETGKRLYPDSLSILFAEARILINRIPLMEISQLAIESRISKEHRDASLLLDECLNKWEEAERQSIAQKDYTHFSRENSDFLEVLDDLLEMVDNFGRDNSEGIDSEDEDTSDPVILSEEHPLFAIRKTNKYNLWWREHTQKFLDNLAHSLAKIQDSETKKDVISLKRELSKRLGGSLLAEAEVPNNIFAKLAYYSDGKEKIDGMTLVEARTECVNLYSKALEYLRAAEEEEEPDSWASVAEAIISLGNVYDLGSEEQEELYKEAECILIRANNVTNGKYESVLENLRHDC